MENSQNEDLKLLIDVLSEGNDHIMELEALLYNYQTLSSEACRLLSSKVQSIFAKAIIMTKHIEQKSLRPPPLAAGSPRSHCTERSFKEQERREISKKRKTLPRWCGQVQASTGSSMEMPIDDGHSWRKYGQKDILGANFPRCYYRCTYRHSHGCLATKLVQRSDSNTSVFDITYRGAHTCNNGVPKPLPSSNDQIIHQSQSFKVKTEPPGPKDHNPKDHKPEYSPSFSSPSTPASSLKLESKVFSSASNPDKYAVLDSEFSDIICASTLTTSSQMLGMDLGVEQLVFDSDFSFDFLLN